MIVLDVIGLPAPQGSKSQMPNGAMMEGSTAKARANLTAWRRAVADAARAWLNEHPQPPLAEPLHLSAAFRFPLPASDPYRWRHSVKPDLSKLIRATEDALVHGGLLKDDSIVWKLDIEKRYAQADETIGARIQIVRHGLAEDETRRTARETAAAARRAARTAA